MSKVQADIGRQGIVVAVVAVLIVAAAAYVGYGWLQSRSAKPSDIAAMRASSKGAPSKESDHYQQVLQKYNDKNADAAAREGQTYLSVPSTRAEAVKTTLPQDPPASAPSAAPAPTPAPAAAQQSAQAPMQRVAYAQQDPEHNKYLEEQVQGLLSNWTAPPPGLATVSKDAKDYAASLSPNQAAARTASAGTAGANGTPAVVIVPAYGPVYPALLRTNVDTDESSVTEAYIPSGPYAGAQLMAPGYKRVGDSASMTFNAMAWHGHTYKVTAVPVDMTTGRSMLAGEVNNRYFSRIFVPALAMGLAKGGQLYQEAGTTAVVSPLGGVTVTAPESPSAKVVGGTIIGGMAQQAGTVLAQDAAAEPVKQVTVAENTTIGIRFLAPVLSSDEVTGDKTPTTDALEASARAAQTQSAAQGQAQVAAQQAALQQAAFQQQPTYGVPGQPSGAYPTAVPIPNSVTPYAPRQ